MNSNIAALQSLKTQFVTEREKQARESQVEGVLQIAPAGFGFIKTDDGKSYFSPPGVIKRNLPGDRVKATLEEGRNPGEQIAVPRSLVQATELEMLAKIVPHETNNQLLFAELMVPGVRARMWINPKAYSTLKCNDLVHVRVKRHPVQNKGKSEVEVVRNYGAFFAPRMPWEIALGNGDLTSTMPDQALNPKIILMEERQDWTEYPFMTIDGFDTLDMDDAFCIERIEAGYCVRVAIADPLSVIGQGESDQYLAQAYDRVESLYLKLEEEPMLSKEISQECCSLSQGDVRPALGCKMVLNEEGVLLGMDLQAVFVKSHAKLSYQMVADLLLGRMPMPEIDQLVMSQLPVLMAFADAHLAHRKHQAIVSEYGPDYSFYVDERTRQILDIVKIEKNKAHQIVEEIMIAANIAMAKWVDMNGAGQHLMYVAHDGLNVTGDEAQNEVFTELGVDPEAIKTLDGFSQTMRTLIESNRVAGLYRYMQGAYITHEQKPHFGLGMPMYATFTSPMRKVCDLHNHRVIHEILARGEVRDFKLNQDGLVHINRKRKGIKSVYRTMDRWLALRWAQQLIDNGHDPIEVTVDHINRRFMKVIDEKTGLTYECPIQEGIGVGDQLEVRLVKLDFGRLMVLADPA